MFDLKNNIGAKSFSFRNIKDNTECADAIQKTGSRTVDLSGCHVNFDAPESWEEVISIYAEKGLSIPGVGVALMKNDEKWNRRFFDFTKQAGGRLVSITFIPDDMEKTIACVEKLCEEYNMVTGIHNHGGYHWLGNTTMLDYVFARSNKSIGLCFDTAWCMHTHLEKPTEWMERYADRIYGIHFKDFLWKPNGDHTDTAVGEGSLDLPAVLEKFKSLEHVESAVIEYEGADPVEQTKKSIDNIKSLL